MGRTVCQAVEAAPDLQLGAQIDVGDDVNAVAGADVAVVFSVPDVVLEHTLACIRHGVHTVVGTTGWDAAKLDAVRQALAEAPAGVGVLVAPNFALGAVLLMKFAAMAAPHFESVEVIELHHPDKVDAPAAPPGTPRSGSLRPARRPAAADPGRHHDEPGRCPRGRGRRDPGARGTAARADRPRGGRARRSGEQLTLRHDSFDRASFMSGVLLGVRQVASRPGLTVGLDTFL